MNTQQSEYKAYIEKRTQWTFSNIQALDEDTWIAYATTIHLTKDDEPEHIFGVIASCTSGFFSFELNALPAMLAWCQKMLSITQEKER